VPTAFRCRPEKEYTTIAELSKEHLLQEMAATGQNPENPVIELD